MNDQSSQKKGFRPIAYVLVTRVKYLLQFFLCLFAANRISLVTGGPARDALSKLADIAQWLVGVGFALLAVEFAWRLIYPRRRWNDVE